MSTPIKFRHGVVGPGVAALNPDMELGEIPKSYPAVPATAKHDAVSEKKVHDQIENWLRQKHCFFIHSRMDKKSTNAIGTPDFVLCWHFTPVAVEVKVNDNPLSDEQKTVRAVMMCDGWKYFTVSSLPEMIEKLNTL